MRAHGRGGALPARRSPVVARAEAHVDLGAIERNCTRLRAVTGADVALCAVVKADGYGHGAVPAARAALAGGADRLAVATAGEALELRAAGIEAAIIVLGPLTRAELADAVEARAEVVAWRGRFLDALMRHARRDDARSIPVHIKLDVGMGRFGSRDPEQLLALAVRVTATSGLRLAGAMTHLPCADEEPDVTRAQVARFRAFGERLRALAPGLLLHAANSAATLTLPEAHLDMVRCGIAIYGLDPFGADPAAHGLAPALELRSYVAALKPLAAGESVGYGARFVARAPTWIATVPIGYGDGWRRAFSDNAEVLVAGRRHPLVGRVSMDSITVDVGADPAGIDEGDEAILLGRQGEERITAEELAGRIDTINYEVTTAITRRPLRVYRRDAG